MTERPPKKGVCECWLDSWHEFHDFVEKKAIVAPAWVYRGQADFNWPLCSSLDRLRKQYPKRRHLGDGVPKWFDVPPLSEKEHLDAFKRAVRGRLGPNTRLSSDSDCDDWWALGQHHGLATPLLDWTRSPYVALFFAFDEEYCLTQNGQWEKPTYRGVYAFSTSDMGPHNENKNSPVQLVSPWTDTSYRLVSQASLLLRLPADKDLEGEVKKKFAGEEHARALWKLRIPNKGRDECLAVLNKMNINHMALFPDLDGAARHVNSLWQPGHEDSIAYV